MNGSNAARCIVDLSGVLPPSTAPPGESKQDMTQASSFPLGLDQKYCNWPTQFHINIALIVRKARFREADQLPEFRASCLVA